MYVYVDFKVAAVASWTTANQDLHTCDRRWLYHSSAQRNYNFTTSAVFPVSAAHRGECQLRWGVGWCVHLEHSNKKERFVRRAIGSPKVFLHMSSKTATRRPLEVIFSFAIQVKVSLKPI